MKSIKTKLGSRPGFGPEGFLHRLKETEKKVQERVVVEMSSSAIINNYRAIQELVPGQQMLPMIKANAYGHGAAWAARHLSSMPGLYGFGVATLEEGAELRAALASKLRKIPLIVFSGTVPWTEEKGLFCERFGLTVVITSEEDWYTFTKGGWPKRLRYELQFNTGMNRLGISLPFVRSIAKACQAMDPSEHPQGVFSHLAMSETPDSKLSLSQLEKFKILKHELFSILPTTQFHLANSGGIWNSKNFGILGLTDVVRPGLALYGVPPWAGAAERGLLPVMCFKVRVVAIHRVKPGESVGYGGTYRVNGNESVYVAILGAGYADGIKRALSNRGFAWLEGRSTQFLGVVSMDLCAVECLENTQIGTWVELIGPQVDIWAQAKAAGTIPYELFTSLSSRVKRIYD